MKYIILFCSAIVLSFNSVTAATGKGFNTAELISNSVQTRCLNWKIIGVCFWLKCSPKCKIKTTPKISHYLPDLTVTNSTDQCPWNEVALLSEVQGGALSTFTELIGSGNPGREGNLDDLPVRFKDAMVVGNPTVRLADRFNVRFLCKSKTKPMKIYFDSRDPRNALQWRGIDTSSPLSVLGGTDAERIESWQPGRREIGRPSKSLTGKFNTLAGFASWGSVYPRRGSVMTGDDVKASAVIAQRAIEIVVRNSSGYLGAVSSNAHNDEQWEIWGEPKAKTSDDCKNSGGIWQPSIFRIGQGHTPGRCLTRRSIQQRPVGEEATDQWQMIYPKVEANCGSFDARANQSDDWSNGRVSESGAYAYNFWQKYKCCIPRSGKYLYSKEF